MDNPKSTASIADHPIHPMIVPFPSAFFVATLVCDLLFWRSANAGWAIAAMWLLGAGLVMALLAALAGVVEFAGDRRIRRLDAAWWHAGTNVAVVVIEAVNLYLRSMHGAEIVIPTGLLLSLLGAVLLLFSGWKGGALVYRYRVGIRHNNEPL